MKKIRFGIASSALVLAFGALPVALSHAHPTSVHAETQVDGGDQCLYLNEIDHGTSGGMYLLANVSDVLPYDAGWSIAYKPVAASGALVVDGVDRTAEPATQLQKLGNDRFYLNAAGAVAEGATITVSGDWHYSDGANDYVFTVEPALSLTYIGGTAQWDYALEEYDRVSLLDAGIANTEYAPINNEYDLSLYDQTRLNHFSLSNNTNSYVFEFELEAKAKEDSEFNLRLGAKTNNWGLDHTIKLNMNGTWGPNGVMEMIEEVAETPTKIRDFDINIAPGSSHTLGIGIVKVKNSTGRLLFVENDGAIVGRKLVKLNDREMGARAAFYYTGSNYAIRNTIPQTYGEEALVPDADYRYFKTQTDLIPDFNSWIDYAITYNDANITLNNNPLFTTNDLNYMKKVEPTKYYIDLPDKSTLNEGDVLKIGGTFKFMEDRSIYRDGEGNVVSRGQGTIETPNYIAHKVAFKEESFVWDGDKFVLQAEYEAKNFAETFNSTIVCSGAGSVDVGESTLGDLWDDVEEAFASLSDGAKEFLKTYQVNGNEAIDQCVSKYDYIVFFKKYSGCNDFMSRDGHQTQYAGLDISNRATIKGVESPILIAVLSSIAAIGSAIVFVRRKRKQ